MKNYKELSTIYDRKFLNYIISRSRQITQKWKIEYEDLVSDGLLKLVEVYSDNRDAPDKRVMMSLVNLYNDVEKEQNRWVHPMSIDDIYYILEGEESPDFEEAYGIMKKSREE